MEHDFEPLSGRCRACGSRQAFHETVPGGTPCPQQGTRAEPLRPEPERRVYASEDTEAICARIAELDAERLARLNDPPQP